MHRIAPSMPQAAVLARLRAVPDGPLRVRYIDTGTQRRSDGANSTYAGFLLEWADGRSFLVDVGMDRVGAVAFGRALEWAMGSEPVDPHGSVGEQMGAAARNIAGVAFTHLHLDHTGGMAELCDAIGRPVDVFQTPDQFERGNFGTAPGLDDLEASGCAKRRRLAGDATFALPGFPGLVALPAGGHTPGSTVFAAAIGGETGLLWVFSGDITNSIEAIRQDRPKPLVYSLLLVPESRARLQELRRWLAGLEAEPRTRIVVSHDLDGIRATGMSAFSP